MELTELVRGYLTAQDYEVDERSKDFFVARRPDLGGTDTVCLWILTRDSWRGRNPEILEDEYLHRFNGIHIKYRGAQLYLVAETIEGLSNDFREKARRDFGVKIRVPVQYFDMPFKYETTRRESPSAIGRLYKEASEFKRVPQAYELLNDGKEGVDLVDDLFEDINNTHDARIWFVIGPAGQGKTIFFKSLFARLHERFMEHKKRHVLCPRPIPMIAEHLQEAAGRNVGGLLDAFLRTEIARPVNRPVFEWIINNRFGIWMMDGLDEVVSKDPNFFPYLYEPLTTPGSRPAILICIRDSLFQSCEELADFIEDASSLVRVFRLKGWDRSAKRHFAWNGLEGRKPSKGEHDTPTVRKFINYIESNPITKNISSLPFYCDKLLEAFKDDDSIKFDNEFSLLDYTVKSMCAREYSKAGGALKEDIISHDTFIEWLEELALDVCEKGGVSPDELKEMANLLGVLVDDKEISEDVLEPIIQQIEMAPFLTQNPSSGRLEFAHEILSEYLAARNLYKSFKTNPDRLVNYLSKQPLAPDSIILRYLAHVLHNALSELCQILSIKSIEPECFRNLVQLITFMPEGDSAFRNRKILLEGRRLAGVNFSGLNLDGVSFRGCDLTDTDFSGTSLKKAHFEGALLKNTKFKNLKAAALEGAEFGNLERFQSIIASDSKNIEDPAEMKEWLQKNTGTQLLDSGPCPTARQLLLLFGKFVYQDGNPRRDELDIRAATKGKYYQGAPEPIECIEAAVNFGYLERYSPKGRHEYERVRRPKGSKYSELVKYVKAMSISPGIQDLLSSLCRIPNCVHVSQSIE